MAAVTRLVYARKWPMIGRLAQVLLGLYGVEIPVAVRIGAGLSLNHKGFGVVIHPRTSIGNHVRLYPGVVVGRKDAYLPIERSSMQRIELQDHVILFPGSKVLGGPGVTTLAEGTILAANAVLDRSTGPWEIWAGMPARQVGVRPPDQRPAGAASAPV